jgi:predicted aconitase
LDGKHGDSVQRAMELLVGIGECYDAEKFIPVASAHLSGVNPVSAGRGGTRFIMKLGESGRFAVPTTTNPTSLDPWVWREMGFKEALFREYTALCEALSKMGGLLCTTCTPYLVGHVPRMREHIAWCESSAVIYANAVLGSRTNREGGPTGLASGITGRTPAYGYHLDENRHGTLKIIVSTELKGDTDYATLGYFVGAIAQDRAPIFTGMDRSVSQDALKCLGAALATSGSVALYHVVGVTPEAPTEEVACGYKKISSSDTFEFNSKDLKGTEESITKIDPEKVDLVVLGCPHASIDQIKKYTGAFSGKKVRDRVEIWILTSNIVKKYAENLGYAEILVSSGVRLVSDTCPSIMPRDFFKSCGYHALATDSSKMAYYASVVQNVLCYYRSLEKFIDVVTEKR